MELSLSDRSSTDTVIQIGKDVDRLEKLFIQNGDLSEMDVVLKKLKFLSIVHTNIPESFLVTLSQYVNVSSLVLNSCSLGDDGLTFLDSVFPNLKELHLENNDITSNGAVTISKFINPHKIRVLDLYKNKIADDGIVKILKVAPQLTHLDIHTNPVMDKGYNFLSKYVNDNTSLEILHWGSFYKQYPQMTVKCFTNFCKHLSTSNIHTMKVCLHPKDGSDFMLETLCEAMVQLNMVKLFLCLPGILDFTPLYKFLERSGHLILLSMEWCEITTPVLHNIIRSSQSLRYLHLKHNIIENLDDLDLRLLSFIDLSHNKISQSDLEKWVATLTKNYHIKNIVSDHSFDRTFLDRNKDIDWLLYKERIDREINMYILDGHTIDEILISLGDNYPMFDSKYVEKSYKYISKHQIRLDVKTLKISKKQTTIDYFKDYEIVDVICQGEYEINNGVIQYIYSEKDVELVVIFKHKGILNKHIMEITNPNKYMSYETINKITVEGLVFAEKSTNIKFKLDDDRMERDNLEKQYHAIFSMFDGK